jgi:diguanylate cyclase (GGDEF)-like protein/putative nucleotidyltransferase with HDIG domain
MPTRVKLAIAVMIAAAWFCLHWGASFDGHHWLRFAVYLLAVLLSSGMKVHLPKGDGSMSVNFPFILLGIVQLTPGEAISLAALSVFAQCRIKVIKPFTMVQVGFNVANVTVSTALACWCYLAAIQRHVELAPALALAATAYFFANTVPVALVIGWSKGEPAFALWRREFPWYLPFYLVGAVLAAIADLISHRFGWTTSLLLIPVVYTIYRAYHAQMKMMRDRQVHLEETEALHLRTIEGLAMAIEAKDHNTHEHLLRVRVYVSEIGTILGLPEEQMQALLTASFLHDIGKLAVPEHIINKPGKLTPEEFEKMKIHPVVGADILERVRFPYPVVPIVRSHHEAWDGSGYPDGLKGEEIPIGARILTIVDCFDALASDRPYRRALPLDKAMEFVKSKSGIQFDPDIVKILEEHYVELERQANEKQEGLKPLQTEIEVLRGAAPAAGFQQDNERPKLVSDTGTLSLHPTGKDESRTSFESLHLIAAASQEAQAIFEMSQMLGSSLSPNETISVMSSRLRSLVPFDCFALYLKAELSLATQYIDGDGARCFSNALIPIGEGLSGWVAQCGKTMLNGNPKVEPHYAAGSDTTMELNSALSLPLFDVQGNIFGVLTIYSARPDAFSRDHLRIVQAIESKFTLSLENALRFRTAEKDAQIDFVTQLPNIRQFFLGMDAEMNRARRSNETLGVVVCDLNSFKSVNDRYGHQTGNMLLQAVAQGFRESCRSYDTVARIGGDEFVFLFPGVDANSCAALLEAIEKTVRDACRELQIEKEVSGSVGAAFYPVDGQTAEELLGVADRRMYSHKRRHYDSIAAVQTSLPLTSSVAAVA